MQQVITPHEEYEPLGFDHFLNTGPRQSRLPLGGQEPALFQVAGEHGIGLGPLSRSLPGGGPPKRISDGEHQHKEGAEHR